VDVNNGNKKSFFFHINSHQFLKHFSYEFDRMSSSGNTRNYRDSGYQQPRADNYNHQQQSRRSNNFPTGNGSRGRRGGGNSYRGGTQSDAGTGGKFNLKKQEFF
jgi:hypothetical protein